MLTLMDYPVWQARALRAALGALFCFQFIEIFPFRNEMFSDAAWIRPEIAPLFFIPNFLSFSLNPLWIAILCAALIGACLLLAFEIYEKAAAIFIWLGLTSLILRNPFFFDFDFGYSGWLLLATLFIPKTRNKNWTLKCQVPRFLWFSGWISLGLSYALSGISKGVSPYWQSGEAIGMFLSSSAARIRIVHGLDQLSPILHVMTWLVLFCEGLFLPFICFRKLRPWMWLGMTLVQIGIGATSYLTQLNIAALIFHLFLFDPAWFEKKQELRRS